MRRKITFTSAAHAQAEILVHASLGSVTVFNIAMPIKGQRLPTKLTRPGPVRLLVASQPSNGSVDSTHYLFRADGAGHVGPPSDRTEADRIEWRPLAEIPALIDRGAIVSGPTLIALLYLLMTRGLPSGARRCL